MAGNVCRNRSLRVHIMGQSQFIGNASPAANGFDLPHGRRCAAAVGRGNDDKAANSYLE
jgi:hypothetical protein